MILHVIYQLYEVSIGNNKLTIDYNIFHYTFTITMKKVEILQKKNMQGRWRQLRQIAPELIILNVLFEFHWKIRKGLLRQGRQRVRRAQYRRALAIGERGPCGTDRRERAAGGSIFPPGGEPPVQPGRPRILCLNYLFPSTSEPSPQLRERYIF
jgi:hypothetical protein